MAAITTDGVLLRGHDYGDTSRILRFYTRDHGLLSVMARGVRGRSGKGGITLATFVSGQVTAHVRPHRDLQTMQDFSADRMRPGLGADLLRFAGASAVGELVVLHTEQEAHPGLYEAVESALDALETAAPDLRVAACLAGLWSVVDALGFSPELDHCVRCAERLAPTEMGRFDLAAGGIRCEGCGIDTAGPRVGGGARTQIARLLAGNLSGGVDHPRAHLGLVSDFVAFHVATRPLKSLRFLADLLPASPAPA